ncbi:hypothetical protein QFZ75_004892 [Streptomyces sp. V3I8]|nr:hypothetical protein [Streptomyces sp. V3I8]
MRPAPEHPWVADGRGRLVFVLFLRGTGHSSGRPGVADPAHTRSGEPAPVPRTARRAAQPVKPSSLAISMRWTSLVPSPISRILESRHMRATGYSFMKP